MPSAVSRTGVGSAPAGVVASVSARHGVGTVATPVETALHGSMGWGSMGGRLTGGTMSLVGPTLSPPAFGGGTAWGRPPPPPATSTFALDPVATEALELVTGLTDFFGVSAVLCQGKWLAEYAGFPLWSIEVNDSGAEDGPICYGVPTTILPPDFPWNTATEPGSLPAIVSFGTEVAVVSTGGGTDNGGFDKVRVEYWLSRGTVMEAAVTGKSCAFAVPVADPWGGLYVVFTAYDPSVSPLQRSDQDTNPSRTIHLAFWSQPSLVGALEPDYVVELETSGALASSLSSVRGGGEGFATASWDNFPSLAIAPNTTPDATLMVVWRQSHRDLGGIVSTIQSLALPISTYGPYCWRATQAQVAPVGPAERDDSAYDPSVAATADGGFVCLFARRVGEDPEYLGCSFVRDPLSSWRIGWSAETRVEPEELKVTVRFPSVAISPDGTRVAAVYEVGPRNIVPPDELDPPPGINPRASNGSRGVRMAWASIADVEAGTRTSWNCMAALDADGDSRIEPGYMETKDFISDTVATLAGSGGEWWAYWFTDTTGLESSNPCILWSAEAEDEVLVSWINRRFTVQAEFTRASAPWVITQTTVGMDVEFRRYSL